MGLVALYHSLYPQPRRDKIFENEDYVISTDYYLYNPHGERLVMLLLGITSSCCAFFYYVQYYRLLVTGLFVVMLVSLPVLTPAKSRYIRNHRLISVELQSLHAIAHENTLPIITINSKLLDTNLSTLKKQKTTGYYHCNLGLSRIIKTADTFNIAIDEHYLTIPNPQTLHENRYYKVPSRIIIELVDSSDHIPADKDLLEDYLMLRRVQKLAFVLISFSLLLLLFF